jgi:hypothetical protein
MDDIRPNVVVQEPAETPAEEIPQKIFVRDPETGLVNGLNYVRRADGRIQWEKMIDPKHIVFNTLNDKIVEEITKTYGKPAKSLVYADLLAEGVEVNPKHILVLLQGFTELLALRGGSARPRIAHVLSYPPEAANVTCECTIDWVPNIEEPNGFTSYGTADANMSNTNGFGYLAAMAGNRALVRAVKHGLRIPILGFDEIAKKDSAIQESGSTSLNEAPVSTSLTPSGTLERAAAEAKIPFDGVKKGASANHRQKMEGDPETWTTWSDISPRDCWTLINIIKEKKAKAAKT